MMNTPIETEQSVKIVEATNRFLQCLDRALEEAEENVRKLQAARTLLKAEILGENKAGLELAMDRAGGAILNIKQAAQDLNEADANEVGNGQ